MSILNSFVADSQPVITVADVYPKSDIHFRSFIVTFSQRVIEALLAENLLELISEDGPRNISCRYPVYRFRSTEIGIVKTTVGAPITAALLAEMGHIYSCGKAVIFGTCGSLDKSIPANALIVPTAAYRDEGVSYHYMPPSDYIALPNYPTVCKILEELQLPYVVGKTWTTDAFYRETQAEIQLRRQEGCIAVEMELAACQAVCNDAGIELFSFLYRADNLDAASWERGQRDSGLSKDARLQILRVAYEIARRL